MAAQQPAWTVATLAQEPFTPKGLAISADGETLFMVNFDKEGIRCMSVTSCIFVEPFGMHDMTDRHQGRHTIYKDGNTSQAGFMDPELLAADSAGNLYTSDALYAQRIVVRRIAAPGTPLSHVTSFTGKGQFRELNVNSIATNDLRFKSRITAIACHSKYLFIAHGSKKARCSCGVWRVDLTTNQVENIIGGECVNQCDCDTQLRLNFYPTAIACSSSGTVYVAGICEHDVGDVRVWRLSPMYNALQQIRYVLSELIHFDLNRWRVGRVKSMVVLPDESLLMACADNTIFWATPLGGVERVAGGGNVDEGDGDEDADEEEEQDNQMVDAVGPEARFVKAGHMALDTVRGVVYVADRGCIRTITLPATCFPPRSSFAREMPSLHTSLAAFPGVAVFDVGGQEMQASRCLLAHRSEYFRGLLAHHEEDAKVPLAHNSPEAFQVVLNYLHLDSIPADLTEDDRLAIELLEFAKLALLPHLSYLCESQLIKAMSNDQIDRLAPLVILPAARNLGLPRLQEHTTAYIVLHYHHHLGANLHLFDKELVLDVIKRAVPLNL
eukprot:jgi/Chlat1/5543/Chrsp369S00844